MTNSIQKEIQVFIGEIVNQFNPERIILFGSHAYGDAKPDSDIDLLVVMDFEGRPHQKAFEMRRKIKRSFPLDLLVRRPGDIADRIRKGDFFMAISGFLKHKIVIKSYWYLNRAHFRLY